MTNLLFAGNDKVFDGILTCLLSIFRRSRETNHYRVYILTMDVTRISPDYIPISNEKIAFLNRVAAQYGDDNLVTRIDVTDLYEKELAGSPNESAYCSPYTLIRLLADLIPELPDEKLLYLDADILFNRDIALLYNYDVTGYEYAAANDHYGKYLVNPRYINAGVLLFNMPEAKRTGLFRKARAWLWKKKLMFNDQSALIRSTTRKRLLPQKCNDQKFLHKSTIVRHFAKRLFWFPYPHTDNIKQWHIEKVHKVFGYHVFDDVFTEYLALKDTFEKEQEVSSHE